MFLHITRDLKDPLSHSTMNPKWPCVALLWQQCAVPQMTECHKFCYLQDDIWADCFRVRRLRHTCFWTLNCYTQIITTKTGIWRSETPISRRHLVGWIIFKLVLRYISFNACKTMRCHASPYKIIHTHKLSTVLTAKNILTKGIKIYTYLTHWPHKLQSYSGCQCQFTEFSKQATLCKNYK